MKYSNLLGIALAVGMLPSSLDAAEPNTTTRNSHNTAHNNDNDRVTPAGLVRASELMNKAIYNRAEEQVGVVNDVVLDTNTGKIKYVALSTGGFLGLGDALHAVPWKAFKSEHQDGEKVCVLNVSNEQLEDAEGFDQDNWPNMADRNWSMKNDRQYDSRTHQQPAQR